jgi:hypothetical protein
MRKNGRSKIDALLRHLARGQDLQDYPATTYERLLLVEKAGGRGLIEWQKERGRYELTPIGWRQLTPRRGLGFASLVVSTAVGAAIGAAALAVLWLPAGALHRSAGAQPPAPVSRIEQPVAVPAPPPADTGGRSTAALQPASAPPAPAAVAEPPVPEQPSAETAPPERQVKKPHRRTAHRHRREPRSPTWGGVDPWRSGQSRYSSRNGQGSWFAFR